MNTNYIQYTSVVKIYVYLETVCPLSKYNGNEYKQFTSFTK